ncbi:MAG TPA: hypothetical protein VFF70_15040, partial [Anaerolineae bacterium]|nr:hypothetical protein [Anaerolineae bacterium]
PHAGGYGVVGIGSDAPGVSVDNPGSGALIFGHELTHDYNVYHTNTADACGSNDNNSDFPYPNSSIQEFGFNPDTGKVYNPSLTHDLMSYCPSGGSKQGWISPFTWNKMYGKVPLTPSTASVDRGNNNLLPFTFYPATGGEALVVHTTISNPISNTNQIGGYLGDMNRIEPALTYLPAPGDYSIELHNGPSILLSQTFTVSFQSEYSAHDPGDPGPTAVDDVAFIMPWAEGTTSITLVVSGTVLDSRAVSLYSPVVTITDPTQVVTWTGGSHLLTWNASDADGDPLTYAVLFSHDGGSNWQLLDTGLISTSYNIDAGAMAGGNDVRFRVVASDGVNIGYDETAYPIVIPNKPPMPMITNPISDTLFAPGDLIVFEGMAIDLEDGSLPDGSLDWSSNRQGGVGLGPTVPMTGLLRGPQLITLTAMDSNGLTATTTVSIYIGYRAYLPIVRR